MSGFLLKVRPPVAREREKYTTVFKVGISLAGSCPGAGNRSAFLQTHGSLAGGRAPRWRERFLSRRPPQGLWHAVTFPLRKWRFGKSAERRGAGGVRPGPPRFSGGREASLEEPALSSTVGGGGEAGPRRLRQRSQQGPRGARSDCRPQ